MTTSLKERIEAWVKKWPRLLEVGGFLPNTARYELKDILASLQEEEKGL